MHTTLILFYSCILLSFTSIGSLSAQELDPRIVEGRITDANIASVNPDNRTIGVFLTVPGENEVSPSDWASQMLKYFDAYGLPVKIILDSAPPKSGAGTHALIYVGGKRFKGNLSSGSISLHHFFDQHEQVFMDLFALYKNVNSSSD